MAGGQGGWEVACKSRQAQRLHGLADDRLSIAAQAGMVLVEVKEVVVEERRHKMAGDRGDGQKSANRSSHQDKGQAVAEVEEMGSCTA